jgi:hypothetical protein
MYVVVSPVRSGLLFVFGLLLGCGGSVTENTQSDGGVRGDATSGGDAAWGPETSRGEAGACSGVRVPKDHRASGEACPMARGAGITMCCPDSGYPGQWPCSHDSECTMGTNGRCLGNAGPAGTHCSYDDCFGDSDCPGNVPCVCRSSASDPSPNMCSTGSGCRVDADCGPCGYCSPSPSFPYYPSPEGPYFCHTQADVCVDNADCPETARGCCMFDPKVSHWACGACPVPPVLDLDPDPDLG